MRTRSGGLGGTAGLVLALAGACSLGDGGTPDFSSFGGTDATPSTGQADDDDDDSSSAGEAEGGSTAAVDGGSTSGGNDEDDATAGTTAPGTTGGTTDPTTGGTTEAATDGTTDATTGSTGGSESSGSSGGEASTSGGVMPGDDYEACNPDGTCDTPGEVCLQVGVGGFCTNTCGSDAECPPTPAGTALTASCEFLLGFPDFSADYCGMIGCNFIFNDCPAGMTCTPVVMGLTVCEWV